MNSSDKVGYDTTDSKRGYKRKRQEYMNSIHEDSDPAARSSTDGAPEAPDRNVARHTSTLDMSDMEVEEEEEDRQDCPRDQQSEAEEMDIEREEQDEAPTQNIDSSLWWPSGYYFGDGSGGKYSRYPTLTRCGVGVQYVDEDKIPRTNISTPLPGLIQSNNRAELYALWIVVMNVEIVGKVDFFTDNKIVRDTRLKGKQRARLANHGDLWADIFEKIEQKGLEVKVYWMPSHTDTQPKKKEKAPEWMKEWQRKQGSRRIGGCCCESARNT